MRKVWKSLLAGSAVGGAMLFLGAAAVAGEISEPLVAADQKQEIENSPQQQVMSQVTSVSQLSDVQPTDWAFQALQSLVERYGCIAGYPNGTFRGNRALTRYEFAAGLNACLNRVNELIATSTAELVTKEDLATLQRLQENFSAELATLRGRVDALEAKTAELEANQFSTTSKLQGEVVAVVSDVFSGSQVNGEEITDQNTTLGARARIEFVTSFTGKDTLFTRIQVNNILSPNIGTPEGSLFFAGEDGNTNAFIDALYYQFPIGEKLQVIALANAGAADDITDTINLFDGDGSFGALSTFGTRNSIYYQMDGAGLGINYDFSEQLALSLGYLSSAANDPTPGNGLFNGAYGALAQLTFKPSDRLKVGFTYINAYNQELGTGSNRANVSSFLGGVVQNLTGSEEAIPVPTISNSYGLQASFALSEKFVLGGWVGYTNTRNLSTAGDIINRGSVDIWNWAVTLGLPDLGKKGNLAGFIFGMEPKVTSSNVSGLEKDPSTSYHIEAFYQYKVSDNITITPGVIWLTAPDHNEQNDNVVIGALRTTFSF
ncbi:MULTISPECIES: iron uptake porin [unclassified Tolypothrix]|uniref:iron uptake porin n=1 Tax=unclassified Tolypothrix TaxID=2649714 RepID=UPI0005EAC56E|nr:MULTISPECIES: iron uptake porin [unclassified Tolypothrix]BAY91450.1 S-layer region-like protein [Microchaete diplosiphon NIES-3275]EKF05508.1 carbohydrate-selective porin, OprB family [Tolypothrix sp. PCC 7601]MBE9085022.1 iron uptake porin [Tolypothrix sp. LEGE 11397]UYD25486.1 iron uptake porin [Tolypothrix sp. PCC 7712]UYD32274.1 iron uptake porin [Tolypothrix sp. PCC 7601]